MCYFSACNCVPDTSSVIDVLFIFALSLLTLILSFIYFAEHATLRVDEYFCDSNF